MRILLTFDIEVWCGGWSNLDAEFPAAFKRYVYGSSEAGGYALPKTVEMLNRQGLRGVFFVEPLFAARFGLQYLRTIVSIIQDAGQEVQLHMHAEWTDEITPAPLPNIPGKRQHLRNYSLEEQTQLIALGIRLLQAAGAPRPDAFRAGNFGANTDTFRALSANGIRFDSSIDATVADSVPDLRAEPDLYSPREIEGVAVVPMSVFNDGFGQRRHAQVGGCSTGELVQAMQAAKKTGWKHFVILSHNFEMLKPGSANPNWIVVNRFDRLCAYLGAHRGELPTAGFKDTQPQTPHSLLALPQVGRMPTLRRYAEQALQYLV